MTEVMFKTQLVELDEGEADHVIRMRNTRFKSKHGYKCQLLRGDFFSPGVLCPVLRKLIGFSTLNHNINNPQIFGKEEIVITEC